MRIRPDLSSTFEINHTFLTSNARELATRHWDEIPRALLDYALLLLGLVKDENSSTESTATDLLHELILIHPRLRRHRLADNLNRLQINSRRDHARNESIRSRIFLTPLRSQHRDAAPLAGSRGLCLPSISRRAHSSGFPSLQKHTTARSRLAKQVIHRECR